MSERTHPRPMTDQTPPCKACARGDLRSHGQHKADAPRTEAPDHWRSEDMFTTTLQETGRLTVHPGDEVAAIAAVRNITTEPFTISLSATPAPLDVDEQGREICDRSYLCPHHTGRRS